MKQYFENNDQLLDKPNTLEYTYYNHKLVFKTNSGLFSKDEIDYHSHILLHNIEDNIYDNILDLGCGYGLIGICLSKRFNTKVDFIDITNIALEYTNINCELNNITNYNIISSNGITTNKSYNLILLNPPIHAGKDICYKLYLDSINHLTDDGIFYLVIHKKHGALSTIEYLNKLDIMLDIVYKKKGLYVVKITKDNK